MASRLVAADASPLIGLAGTMSAAFDTLRIAHDLEAAGIKRRHPQ